MKKYKIEGFPDIPNLVIPEWLINPRSDEKIILRKFSIPQIFLIVNGKGDYVEKRFSEIDQEISEELFYYP